MKIKSLIFFFIIISCEDNENKPPIISMEINSPSSFVKSGNGELSGIRYSFGIDTLKITANDPEGNLDRIDIYFRKDALTIDEKNITKNDSLVSSTKDSSFYNFKDYYQFLVNTSNLELNTKNVVWAIAYDDLGNSSFDFQGFYTAEYLSIPLEPTISKNLLVFNGGIKIDWAKYIEKNVHTVFKKYEILFWDSINDYDLSKEPRIIFTSNNINDTTYSAEVDNFKFRKAAQIKVTTTSGFSNVSRVSYSPLLIPSYKSDIESILCSTKDCDIFWTEPEGGGVNYENILGNPKDGVKSYLIYESNYPDKLGIVRKEIFELEQRHTTIDIGINQKKYFRIGVKNIWDQEYILPDTNHSFQAPAETNQTLILSGHYINNQNFENRILLTNMNGLSFMSPSEIGPPFLKFDKKQVHQWSSSVLGQLYGSEAAFYEPNNSILIMGGNLSAGKFYELSLNGKNLKSLRNDFSNQIHAPFIISPNKEWVYFHDYDWYDGDIQIFRAKLSGEEYQNVTDGIAGKFEIVNNVIIVKNSSCEVFDEYRIINFKLYSIDENNNVTLLFSREEKEDGVFASGNCVESDGFISNDLSQYVFSSKIGANGKYRDIYIVDLKSNNKEIINLTNDLADSYSPKILNNKIHYRSSCGLGCGGSLQMNLDGSGSESVNKRFYNGKFINNRKYFVLEENGIEFYDGNLNLIQTTNLNNLHNGKMDFIYDIIDR